MLKVNRKQFIQVIKIFSLFLLFGFVSCGKPDQSTERIETPAKVTNAVEESELSTIKLTPKAEERLGIEISAVEIRELPGHLNVGGEINALPGNEVSIEAPLAGTILST